MVKTTMIRTEKQNNLKKILNLFFLQILLKQNNY